ncbi:MAG: histidine phosphatase family protein [Actinomycetota bacterium]|nr:histidine phosphatase family protein [Actinomycetota bacterium]
MELVLIRHARPHHIDGADGPADPPLTDIGHRQALAMADWFGAEPVDALYVSPLARARQTVAPLERLLGREATVIDGVREFDADGSSYVPIEVLRRDKVAWRAYLAEEAALDRAGFAREVTATLEEVVVSHRGQRVAVVCHGGVINVWASHLLGLEPRLFFNPDYTSINRFLGASSGERSIVSLNETAHLRADPDLRLS